MKFRDFVGYESKKKTEYKIKEKRDNFCLGFGVDKKYLKNVFDYIRSWFIRYKIPFKPINPYINLYTINAPYIKNNFLRMENNRKIFYEPMGTITVISSNRFLFPKRHNIKPKNGKDVIVLDYIENDFNNEIENILREEDIDIISKECYVRLFEVKSNIINPKMYEDMMYSIPRIESVKLGNLSIVRRN